MSHLVVTAADEAYASLLLDLIASLGTANKFDVGCLDLGLGDDTLRKLGDAGVRVVKPTWPFKPHSRFDKDATFLARAIRPFLRDYFPGYQTYIWLDADCWVQDGKALDDLVFASVASGLACVPAVDRSYFYGAQARQWSYERYKMGLGEKEAAELIQFNYINSGVFALRETGKHWVAWRERFQKALERWDGTFLSDQAVLNAIVYLDRMPASFLPSRYNWICHLALPVWAPVKRVFVSPHFPWQPLAIIHNTFNDKALEVTIQSRAGGSFSSKLTYSAYRALVQKTSVDSAEP